MPGMKIRSARPLCLGVVLALGARGAQGAAPVAVTGLELRAAGGGDELRLTLTGAAAPHLFTLEHPDRIVLDLAEARLGAGVRVPKPSPGIVAVRVARHDGDGLRVVLELATARTAQLSTRREHGGRAHLTVQLGGPAAATSAAAPSPPAAPPAAVRALDAETARPLVIAVDAGHGGEDPGAIGKSGTREKNVTLAVARALASRIDAEPGMHAYLTRDSDVFVPLRTRIVSAARAQADLFVSVHADAVADRDISGASVYVLSAHGASSEAARRLADRENAADLVGGVSLKDKDPLLASVLLDLSQSAAMSASEVAAQAVLRELDQVGDVRKSQVQRAGFLVLKSPDIPSMLVETAYITNPVEERKLGDARHQEEIAAAILTGIKAYFRAHPPNGVRLAALAPAGGAQPH